MKIPKELTEKKVGSEQTIARFIKLDGLDVLIRLQSPFEEPPEDFDGLQMQIDDEGNIFETEDESWMEFGTCVIVEAWSAATQSVVTQGIRPADDQTDAEFAFGARYLFNHGTDEEWIDVLRSQKIDRVFKMAINAKGSKIDDPKVNPFRRKQK